MTLPCPICYESHQETREIQCACGGVVDCTGSEAPKRRVNGEVVWFLVSCTVCDRVFSVDSRTGAKGSVQEPVMPGGMG